MFLHCGVELLGQIIGYIRHPRLFLIGSTDAALVFVGFLVILLFGILAVSLGSLEIDGQERSERQRLHNSNDEVMQLSWVAKQCRSDYRKLLYYEELRMIKSRVNQRPKHQAVDSGIPRAFLLKNPFQNTQATYPINSPLLFQRRSCSPPSYAPPPPAPAPWCSPPVH